MLYRVRLVPIDDASGECARAVRETYSEGDTPWAWLPRTGDVLSLPTFDRATATPEERRARPPCRNFLVLRVVAQTPLQDRSVWFYRVAVAHLREGSYVPALDDRAAEYAAVRAARYVAGEVAGPHPEDDRTV